MEGKTHIVGSITAAAVTHYLFTSKGVAVDEPFIYYVSAVFGGLLPDICQPNSISGQKVKKLSKSINKQFGHRTITHSILFTAVIYWLIGLLTIDSVKTIQLGVITGIISHLLLDAFTTKGIQLLYPFKIRFRFPLYIKTGSKLEGLLFFSFVLISLWIGYQIWYTNINAFTF
ncbi:metal-dependent hydrolase [Bacillus taeanensis]|uniref:Metal-dependent hydrolase n=1 Tax=Bacillus taeanensis TaxID=273032 RepID=A0A366XTF5_9BACI|nr:metal-dependent hydrolase [Bacillus taeanensis]RBW69177.1 hypothetical protein DS031_12375 [Bacillus taeanensis]